MAQRLRSILVYLRSLTWSGPILCKISIDNSFFSGLIYILKTKLRVLSTVSKLYRPSDPRLSAKLVPSTFSCTWLKFITTHKHRRRMMNHTFPCEGKYTKSNNNKGQVARYAIYHTGGVSNEWAPTPRLASCSLVYKWCRRKFIHVSHCLHNSLTGDKNRLLVFFTLYVASSARQHCRSFALFPAYTTFPYVSLYTSLIGPL
jgi:hypothetical protein